MFRIARVDPLRVEIIVPAELFGTVEKGMLAQVTPDLPNASALLANVVLVDKLIDPASNTFRVRAVLPNADKAVPSGLRCHAEIFAAAEPAGAVPPPAPAPGSTAGPRQADLKLNSKRPTAKDGKAAATHKQ